MITNKSNNARACTQIAREMSDLGEQAVQNKKKLATTEDGVMRIHEGNVPQQFRFSLLKLIATLCQLHSYCLRGEQCSWS